MAAPPFKHIGNLGGYWLMDKSLSDDVQPLLKLQQIPWVFRKAYDKARIKLEISQSTTTQAEKDVVQIDIIQTASGWTGTRELRTLNGAIEHHTDYIFGSVESISYFVHSSTRDTSNSSPGLNVDPRSQNPWVKAFLRGEISCDGSFSSGFLFENFEEDDLGPGEGLWVYTVSHNLIIGWTAEQIWGFEMIQNTRYHTRRVAVWKQDGRYELARLVYRYLDSS